jgi:hypothetical protein
MYHDLKSRYWWYGVKRVVPEYVTLCDNCQRVKEEQPQLSDVRDVFHVSQLRSRRESSIPVLTATIKLSDIPSRVLI